MIVNDDMSFYFNQNGTVEYNNNCCNCPKDCKQSCRAELISCSKLREEEKENDT
ncbi:MAG: hypothetical protein IKL09_01250 [Clostridia bacterium]|nr:hypothetical protein [Clostridia bacterium]